jgi:hypothetical protein
MWVLHHIARPLSRLMRIILGMIVVLRMIVKMWIRRLLARSLSLLSLFDLLFLNLRYLLITSAHRLLFTFFNLNTLFLHFIFNFNSLKYLIRMWYGRALSNTTAIHDLFLSFFLFFFFHLLPLIRLHLLFFCLIF